MILYDASQLPMYSYKKILYINYYIGMLFMNPKIKINE